MTTTTVSTIALPGGGTDLTEFLDFFNLLFDENGELHYEQLTFVVDGAQIEVVTESAPRGEALEELAETIATASDELTGTSTLDIPENGWAIGTIEEYSPNLTLRVGNTKSAVFWLLEDFPQPERHIVGFPGDHALEEGDIVLKLTLRVEPTERTGGEDGIAVAYLTLSPEGHVKYSQLLTWVAMDQFFAYWASLAEE